MDFRLQPGTKVKRSSEEPGGNIASCRICRAEACHFQQRSELLERLLEEMEIDAYVLNWCVQLMGDPRGKPANRLQLRLRRPVLRSSNLGEILTHEKEATDAAGLFPNGVHS